MTYNSVYAICHNIKLLIRKSPPVLINRSGLGISAVHKNFSKLGIVNSSSFNELSANAFAVKLESAATVAGRSLNCWRYVAHSVFLLELNGDTDSMLRGITDYVFNIKGKTDISDIVQEYFKTNGYNFDSGEDEEDDDWDDEW